MKARFENKLEASFFKLNHKYAPIKFTFKAFKKAIINHLKHDEYKFLKANGQICIHGRLNDEYKQ